MDQFQLDHLKGAVEALLFVSEKPVTVDQLKEAVAGSTMAEVKAVLVQLKDEYGSQMRGMAVVEIAGGWQMLSSSSYAEYIREFYKTRHKEKLSRAALEALAIIAYKQPVSRTDVEVIRGVNSDGTVMHLLNKGLIKIAGRKEVPGRPYVYGTTNLFLEFFGLRALEDLPKLEEFPALMPVNEVGHPVVEADASLSVPTVSPEVTPVTAVEALEEVARVQTGMDEQEIQSLSEETGLGESSGQARLMSEAGNVPVDVMPEGDGDGSEPAASED
ncbi:MAG: SMC-Scp complex subunit ScpB [Candidatus Omnitrophota bacterium]